MDDLPSRCICILTDDADVQESDIFERFCKFRHNLLEEVFPAGKGRWLLVFNSAENDDGANAHLQEALLRKGSTSLKVCSDKPSSREIRARFVPADAETIEKYRQQSLLNDTLWPVMEPAISRRQSEPHNEALWNRTWILKRVLSEHNDELLAGKYGCLGKSEPVRLFVIRDNRAENVDLTEFRKVEWKKDSLFYAYLMSDRDKSENAVAKHNASAQFCHLQVGKSAIAENADHKREKKRSASNPYTNSKFISLLELQYLSLSTEFIRSVVQKYGVSIAFPNDEQEQIVIDGWRKEAAVQELQKKLAQLKRTKVQVNAARVWLLRRSNEAVKTMRQLLSENKALISWMLPQFSSAELANDRLVQLGLYDLLGAEAPIVACSETQATIDCFLAHLKHVIEVKKFQLVGSKSMESWEKFLTQLAARHSNEFYLQIDSVQRTCTFVALKKTMQILQTAMHEFISKNQPVTLLLYVDDDMLRFARLYLKHELHDLAASERVNVVWLDKAIQMTGENCAVESVNQQALRLIRSVQRTTLNYDSSTLLRVLSTTAALQDIERNNECTLVLNKTPDSLRKRAKPIETLRLTSGSLTVVVRCLNVLHGSTDVVACSNNANDKLYSLLLDSAGKKVSAEIRAKPLYPGEVLLTSSGDLQNYAAIAHMCVDASTSQVDSAFVFKRVVCTLLKQCAQNNYSSVTFAIDRQTDCFKILETLRARSERDDARAIEVHFASTDLEVADRFAFMTCLTFGLRRSSLYPSELLLSKPEHELIDTFRCTNGLTVQLLLGKLSSAEAQMIATVSAFEEDIIDSDDVSASVLAELTRETEEELKLKLKTDKTCLASGKARPVVVTTSSLPVARFIVHGQLARFISTKASAYEKQLAGFVKQAVRSACSRQLTSVALAPFGYGKLQYPLYSIADTILRALLQLDAKDKLLSNLQVLIVLPKNSIDLLITFRNSFKYFSLSEVTTPRRWRESRSRFVRVTEVNAAEALCRAECPGLQVLLLCTPVLSRSAAADALIHLVDRELQLSSAVSKELATAFGSEEKFRAEINNALSKLGARYSPVRKDLLHFRLLVHAEATDSLASEADCNQLRTALKLCEHLHVSSVAIPVEDASNLTNLLNVISAFAKLRKSDRLDTIKLLCSTDRSEAFLLAAADKCGAANQSDNVSWNAQSSSAQLQISVLHCNPNCIAGVKRDLQTIICNRRNHMKKEAAVANLLAPLQAKPTVMRLISEEADQIEVFEPHNLILSSVTLGKGSFGVVRIGVFTVDNIRREVAVKQVKNETEDDLKDLVNEAALMNSLSHPNIVKIYGICPDNYGVMVIMERVKLSSLLQYLEIAKEKITEYRIATWMQQVAEGMAYLESKSIIHRDLAARNILLESPFLCKISDFGLSRQLKTSSIYLITRTNLPWRWCPPESLAETGRNFNSKSDVWSYGVLMWETYSLGSKPYENLIPIPSLENPFKLFNCLREGYRLETPKNCCPTAYDIMLKCWALLPSERPSFEELKLKITKLVDEVQGRIVREKEYALSIRTGLTNA